MTKALNFLLFVCLSQTALANKLGWLSFGDLRGNIEPCGCDPKTDMGGIRRIANSLRLERTLKPDLLLFDLGNNFPVAEIGKSFNEIDKVKLPFLEEGISSLKPTARLFNYAEQQLKLSHPKFVLTNSKDFPKVKREIADKNFVVYGIYDRANATDLDQYLQKSFAKHSQKTKFLLYSGSDEFLVNLLKRHSFDVIISSNQSEWSTQPGKEEKENPKLLERSLGEKTILMVPLGGQGFLRGGELLAENKPFFQRLVLDAKAKSEGFNFVSPYTWLTKEHDPETELSSLFKRYRAAQTKQFTSNAESRVADLKDSKFAGAEACKGCHESAYNVWKASKHHGALVTLKQKKAD